MPEGHEATTAQRVASVANRLRLIQDDFADQPPQERHGYLQEALVESLANLTEVQAKDFLEQLAGFFPAWDPQEAQLASSPPDGSEAAQDPALLASRLAGMASTLTAAQRQAILSRLNEAGLVPTGRAWPGELAQAVAGKLGVAPGGQLDPEAVLHGLLLLVEFTRALEQVGWKTWKVLAPRSTLRQPGKLEELLGRFASGDRGVGTGQVAESLERSRQLVAALIASVGEVGRRFANQYVGRFSPAEIEKLVHMEKGGMFTSSDVRCWKKYQELARTMDPASVEQDLRRAIVDAVESWIGNSAR